MQKKHIEKNTHNTLFYNFLLTMIQMTSMNFTESRLRGKVGALGCAPPPGPGPRRRSDSEDLVGRAASVRP